MFESKFPKGITAKRLTKYIRRGKDLLRMFGAAPGDAAWTLVRKLEAHIAATQAATGNSTLERSTFADKLTTMVDLILGKEDLNELFEIAMSSAIIQSLASKFAGVPLEKVARDPFAPLVTDESSVTPGNPDDESESSSSSEEESDDE